MKRTILSLSIGTALLAGSLQAEVQQLQSGTKVQFNDLPAAVQSAVKAQAGGANIEDVDKGTLDGKTVYEVAFKENGKHNELRVSDNGTVVDRIVDGQSTLTASTTAVSPAPTAPTPTVTTPQVPTPGRQTGQQIAYDAGFEDSLKNTQKVPYAQVPEAVKKIVQERGHGNEVQDVERGIGGGMTAYQIAYKKNGRHVELRITEDGQKIKEVANGKQIFRQVPATIDQVPANVRQTITSRVGNNQISKIGMGTNRGVDFYRVFYNKNGKPMELRITGHDVKEMAAGQPLTDPAGSKLR